MTALSYTTLNDRRLDHAAWKLLRADHAPLVLGFLDEQFLTPSAGALPAPDVTDALEGYLERINALEPGAYPKAARAYLDDWAAPERSWLRRSYPATKDIAFYEPTPAVETAASFCRSLAPREFVGAASRLLTIRETLRRIAVGSQIDPTQRIAALEQQRAEIDAQLEAIRRGEDILMDDTAIRENYQEVRSAARALLGDMRAVQENFRELDRAVRAKAVTWEGSRGAFLDDVFGTQHEIGDSEQGLAWRAFMQHLLDRRGSVELDTLLSSVQKLPALADLPRDVDTVLRRDLLRAAEDTQQIAANTTSQLRRFLEDASWAEGRRLNLVIRETLRAALHLAEAGPHTRAAGMNIDALEVTVGLPAERPPYTPKPRSTDPLRL